MKSGSFRFRPGWPKVTTDCGMFIGMTWLAARGRHVASGTLARCGLLRQGRRKPSSSAAANSWALMSPTTATCRLSRAKLRLTKFFRSRLRHRADGVQAALCRRAVGMAAIDLGEERVCGNALRVFILHLDDREDLLADAFDGVRVHARLGQRQAQQTEGFLLVLGQRLEAASHRVARGVEGQFDGEAFELFLERLAVDVARAFIQHAAGEIGEAVLAGGVLRAAALESRAAWR